MKTFGNNLSAFVNEALHNGVPPQQIILVLEVTKIELVNTLLQNATQAASATPPAPLIVLPPNHERKQGN